VQSYSLRFGVFFLAQRGYRLTLHTGQLQMGQNLFAVAPVLRIVTSILQLQNMIAANANSVATWFPVSSLGFTLSGNVSPSPTLLPLTLYGQQRPLQIFQSSMF